MESSESTARAWRSAQVYGLAVICLLAGVIIGYLARAPLQSSTVNPKVTMPAVAHAANAKATPAPLKQGADGQIEALLAQLRKSPDDPLLLAETGKAYYQMRRFPEAARYYSESARLKPDAVVLVKLGGAYHFGGDDDKALGAWNHALRLDPGNPDALFNIGYVKWYGQGNRQEAMAAWQQLLKTNPNHPKRAQVEELIAQIKRHPETSTSGKK